MILVDEDMYCKRVTLLTDKIMVLTRKLLQKKAELDKGKSMMPEEDDMDWYIDEIREHTEKKGIEVMKDKVSQEHVCKEEVPLNNNIGKLIGDLIEILSEAVEQGMDDHLPDDLDGVKGEQVPNHVGKKGNLEFLVCKQVPNHHGDELEDKGRPMKRKMVYVE
ncbi:hypothetical protein Tco_1499933 [Tanacetum coccineum]